MYKIKNKKYIFLICNKKKIFFFKIIMKIIKNFFWSQKQSKTSKYSLNKILKKKK